MSRAHVLVTEPVADDGPRYLRAHGYLVTGPCGASPDALRAHLGEVDAVLVRNAVLSAELLAHAERLRVIGRHGVGVDNVDVAAATRLGIRVTNAPVSNTDAVAEHTLGALLALARDFRRADRAVREGNFGYRIHAPTADVAGATLGLVGVGRIGGAVARRAARGLDMRVLGYDPYVDPATLSPDVRLVGRLEELLRAADFVSLHVPLNDETRGLVGREQLALLKSSAYLVNAARGGVVDEAALVDVLRRQAIRGAAVDVFDPEPPEPGNPLLGLDNVLLSPHTGASTPQATARMALHAAMGIHEVLSGVEPSWPVNPPVG